jgi:hypothetical protein
VMIANVAPNSNSFEETLNTLKYANRAKNIKTNVSRNVVSVNYHISGPRRCRVSSLSQKHPNTRASRAYPLLHVSVWFLMQSTRTSSRGCAARSKI